MLRNRKKKGDLWTGRESHQEAVKADIDGGCSRSLAELEDRLRGTLDLLQVTRGDGEAKRCSILVQKINRRKERKKR